MKRLILFISAVLMMGTGTSYAQVAGAQKIKECKDSPKGETICTALILNRKLQRVLKKLNNNGGGNSGVLKGKIQFYNEPGCNNDSMGGPVVFFADTIDEARDQCRSRIQQISSYQDIDAYISNDDGSCITSMDPSLESLVDMCVSASF